MPITLPPIPRRRFLGTCVAAGAACFTGRFGWAADEPKLDANTWALFSDTHIAKDRKEKRDKTVMADNLMAAVDDVLSQSVRPAKVLVNGDCAYLKGEPGDYATLVELLAPLRKAGLTIILTMGNHDHRERFYEAFPESKAKTPLVADCQVSIVESEHANLLMLDSLEETNKTPGKLGDKQLEWLDAELARRAAKPAIVMAHHPLDHAEMSKGGLKDTKQLLACLAKHKHVRGYLYGHTHNWQNSVDSGLKLVNLPAVAYTFGEKQTSGWVLAKLDDKSVTLQINTLDKKHDFHGQKVVIDWKAA